MKSVRRAALAVALMVFWPAASTQSVSAHVDACAGFGVMSTSQSLTYPAIGPFKTTGFAIASTVAACVASPAFTASGTMGVAWCGLAYGAGFATGGHAFGFIVVGGVMTLSGEVEGDWLIHADASAGHSCVTGASGWLVTGSVVLNHGA